VGGGGERPSAELSSIYSSFSLVWKYKGFKNIKIIKFSLGTGGLPCLLSSLTSIVCSINPLRLCRRELVTFEEIRLVSIQL